MPKVPETWVGDTIERIIASGLHLAERRGYHGFTVRDLCVESAASVGAIYDHFEDKRDLIRACIRARADHRTSARIVGATLVDGHPLDVLNEIMRRHVEFVAGRWGAHYCALDVAAWAEYLKDPEAAEPAVGNLAFLLASLYEVIREGQRTGQVERHLFAPAAAQALAAVFLGLQVLRRLGWKAPPRHLGDAVGLFLRGFEPES